MATKKRNYGGLTGGTGDVNPQTYTVFTGVSTSAVTQFPVPVPKFSSGIDKAIVMELLGVQWDMVNPPTGGTGAADFFNVNVNLTTQSVHATSAGGLLQDPKSLSTFRRQQQNLAVPTNAVQYSLSEYDDLTDQAGHGLLIATDNIYLDVVPSTGGNYVLGGNIVCRMIYRMKEVKLVEYIGIVQSQQ